MLPFSVCDPSSPLYDPIECATSSSGGGTPSVCDVTSPDFNLAACLTIGGTIGGMGILPTPPPTPTPGGEGSGTGAGGSLSAPVIVNVTVPVSLTNDIMNNIDSAVNAAIASIAQEIHDGLAGIVADLQQALGGLSNTLGTFIQSAFGGLTQTLNNIIQGIGKGLSAAFGSIFSNLGAVVGGIKEVLSQIWGTLEKHITDLVQAVKDHGADAIIPVLTNIGQFIKDGQQIYEAIKNDIHLGIGGILQIPGAITSGIAGINAQIDRTIQQIGIAAKTEVDSTLKTGSGIGLADVLETVRGAIATGGFAGKLATTFPGTTKLEATSTFALDPQILSRLQQMAKDLINDAKSLFKENLDDSHNTFTEIANMGGLAFDVLGELFFLVISAVYMLEPLGKIAEEIAHTILPVSKLDIADTIKALSLGIISKDDATAELQALGFSDQRINTLIDLSVFVEPSDKLIDLWYRDIITDDDLSKGLSKLGYTDDQKKALQEGSQYLPSFQDLIKMYQYDILDDDSFKLALARLRLTPDQIQAITPTIFSAADPVLRAELSGSLDPANQNWLVNTLKTPAPQEFLADCRRHGLSDDAAQLIWRRHWNMPDWRIILQSYFRGFRSKDELQSVMRAQNIPQELWDEYERINRPLIPFRSIPTLVKDGVMSILDATSELQAHGFDPIHISWLLKSIGITPKTTAAAAAQGVTTLSIATARTLFNDGAITEDQYTSVLEAHNYPADLAKAQAKADQLAAHAKQRKQVITDLTNEVLVGVTTVDDATTQLQNQGYTNAEISKFQVTLSKQLKVAAKHPSLADLDKFLKAQLITVSDYSTELQAQGWSDPWLSAFVALVAPPPPQTTTT